MTIMISKFKEYLNEFFDAGETRMALLKLCLDGIKVNPDVDMKEVVEKLNGYTGSDITNVCR